MRALLFSLLLLAGCATAPASGDVLAEMQALEAERGAAIRSGDPDALERIYAADFEGVTATGVQIDRAQLFAVFARTRANPALFEGSTSEVLSARQEGGVIVVVGRLRFGGGESMYTHVFRRVGDHWELFAAAASPVR